MNEDLSKPKRLFIKILMIIAACFIFINLYVHVYTPLKIMKMSEETREYTVTNCFSEVSGSIFNTDTYYYLALTDNKNNMQIVGVNRYQYAKCSRDDSVIVTYKYSNKKSIDLVVDVIKIEKVEDK